MSEEASYDIMPEEEWNRLSYLFKKASADLSSLTPEEHVEFTNIDPAVMGVLALTYSDEPVEELINRLLKGEFGKKKRK
jgi:hypothetical protein